MAAAVEFVEGYRWVVTALIANIILNLWMAAQVSVGSRAAVHGGNRFLVAHFGVLMSVVL